MALISKFLGHGNAAARPATPSLGTGVIGFWWSDDAGALSTWDGSAWHDIGASGGKGTVVTNATAQSIPDNTLTQLTFDTTVVDEESLFASNEFTIATSGWHAINGFATYAANATGTRYLEIAVNGTRISSDGRPAVITASFGTSLAIGCISRFTAGDVIMLRGQQVTGGALNATAARFSAVTI